VFKNGVATFDGVAGAVVEPFPSGCPDRNITDEAAGAVREALGDIDDFAVRPVRGLERAFGRRIRDRLERDERLGVLEASLIAAPLTALTLRVKAVGGERIAEGTEGAPFVIIAAQGPADFVAVDLMAAQINHPFGAQLVDGREKNIVTQASIAGHSVEIEVRVEILQL